MLKIGIIGAGSISQYHIESYIKNKAVKLVAIADLNESLAKQRAETYNIPNYYTDYHKILEDPEIDAVSILTPTFTHCNIVIEALRAGKKCLCEKPPARTIAEAEQAVKVSEETGNLLMWAFVSRFNPEIQLLKKYIDDGKIGRVHHAEAIRLARYKVCGGWFMNKEKSGGGALIDSTIHEIDSAMYLMGYPKVKSVLGFSTNDNADMIGNIKCMKSAYNSSDTNTCEYNIESMASGYVTLENGASLYIKSGYLSYNPVKGQYIELIGSKGGTRFTLTPQKELKILSNMDGYLMESSPVIENPGNAFDYEINHFVDCCINNTSCICKPEQAIDLLKIIEGIYRSADTCQPIVY